MTGICKEIFRAIHEGKWLSIAYCNKQGETTSYWIGIKQLDLTNKSMLVEGLHLGKCQVKTLKIFIDSIVSAALVEGTYMPANESLLTDIRENPEKYQSLFGNIANMKILNYLADCSRLDATPYKTDYHLITCLDGDKLAAGDFHLSGEQFKSIVQHFQHAANTDDSCKKIRQLALNELSIHTNRGLYLLAYRRLDLDVGTRSLRAAEQATICKEFRLDGQKLSIRQFLDDGYSDLLEDFERCQEEIKDLITRQNPHLKGVDDMPYLIAVGTDNPIDLHAEYNAIHDMYTHDKATPPVRAFFGELVRRPVRRKDYPLALLNKRVNLDQLLAVNNAMKYPLAYIQGPPGTGKTNTIINTILTAFFHGRTVLLASYNNHPIDGAFGNLQTITYKGKRIPFPAVRLGNNQKVGEALEYIKQQYEYTKEIPIFSKALQKNRDDRVEQTGRLTELLRRHEEILDLREKEDMILHLLKSRSHMTFQFRLRTQQLLEVRRQLAKLSDVTDEDAQALLLEDVEELKKYLYYTSARYIQRLKEPKNQDLLDLLYLEDTDEKVSAFNRYLSKGENLNKFLRIFPIVATTCISAHKLGEPQPYFDMVIMDEASQCNTAVSLVPILRGESLMLVGDPQQLNPVILLDEKDNAVLRAKYDIPAEYDYIKNSIYKTYLASDSVSDEVLLRYHYRCHKRIIDFNNKKYYNGRLEIKSEVQSANPLVFVDVQDGCAEERNTSVGEARQILSYIDGHPQQQIGIITPFANQKRLINAMLAEKGRQDITCGTVHAFQGDEKDVVLFSLALTDETYQKTYDWLKNNRELINVATSRAKQSLIVFSSSKNLQRLHAHSEEDDLYELVQYVKTNGETQVTPKTALSRALGIKPYSTETEAAFLENLNHALDNLPLEDKRYIIHKEVAISHVFKENPEYDSLFYMGRFDFVVYERISRQSEVPLLAIELDGKEHLEDDVVRRRDEKKNRICREHGFELIRVENTYARRYHYIKDILMGYFKQA